MRYCICSTQRVLSVQSMWTCVAIVYLSHLSSSSPCPLVQFWGRGGFLPPVMGSLFTCVIESYFDICMLSVAGMAGRNCPLLKHQNGCHVHWLFLSYFPSGILCTLLGVSTASVHTPLSLPIKTSKSKGWNVPVSAHSGKLVLNIWKQREGIRIMFCARILA